MRCRHVLCLPHTIQVWGIVYLCSGHAKYLLPDKRTTPHFLFLLPVTQGAEWQKLFTQMEKQNYIAPEIEAIEVAVEQGFAASGNTEDPENGGWIPMNF